MQWIERYGAVLRGHFLQGLVPLQRDRFFRDVIAGMTLAALAIPEVMGYTKIIGTPLITGLYTLVLPVLVFGFLGASRHLVIGADSATAAMVSSGLAGMAVVGSASYVGLTSEVAILTGVLILIARMLDLGFVANFLSRTVLIGFLSGVGVQVAMGELHGMLGLEKPAGSVLPALAQTLQQISQTHPVCLALALAVLMIIIIFERLAPRWPGTLLAVIGAIIVSQNLPLSQYGVQLVGAVPQGLPQLVWPSMSLSQVSALFSLSFSCAVVVLAQSAATSRAYAQRYDERLDQNSDLVGLGLGNFASALSGSFVINGSPTKTAIVDNAGGRSQIAQITMALLTVLVLLFLTGPLAALPNPVLAAIVFMIGLKLVDRRGMRDLYRHNRGEFWLALLTGATVVVAGVMPGIILALVLSLLYHVRTSYKPGTAVLSPDESGHWLPKPIVSIPVPQPAPGLVVYWFGADLFYANADYFMQEVLTLAQASSVRWMVIDAGSITAMDYSAESEVNKLGEKLQGLGVQLVWVHVRGELLEKAKKFRTYETLRECLNEYRRS